MCTIDEETQITITFRLPWRASASASASSSSAPSAVSKDNAASQHIEASTRSLARICVYVYMWICACIQLHVNMHKRAYVCICVNIHTYTHKNAQIYQTYAQNPASKHAAASSLSLAEIYTCVQNMSLRKFLFVVCSYG